jgi:DNA-directed RNA polymerase specialized sigma24 family protein
VQFRRLFGIRRGLFDAFERLAPAEDIVSDALMRALMRAEADPPQPGKAQAWFTRIVFNRGVDFLRARDGRRREG